MRQHGATQDDIEKHRRMLADTQKDAEAHRAHADEARRHAEGLPGFASAIPYSLMQHPLCEVVSATYPPLQKDSSCCSYLLDLSPLEACACCHQ